MKTRVELSEQVLNFVRSLAPEPPRALRLGLRGLAEGRGDLKQIEGELAGWCRLPNCRWPRRCPARWGRASDYSHDAGSRCPDGDPVPRRPARGARENRR